MSRLSYLLQKCRSYIDYVKELIHKTKQNVTEQEHLFVFCRDIVQDLTVTTCQVALITSPYSNSLFSNTFRTKTTTYTSHS